MAKSLSEAYKTHGVGLNKETMLQINKGLNEMTKSGNAYLIITGNSDWTLPVTLRVENVIFYTYTKCLYTIIPVAGLVQL